MINKFILTLIYLIFFFNSNILSEENKKILKVGLLAPLTGQYSGLGNSILYSLQLALEELGDENVFIFPKDSGFNNKEKLNKAIQDIKLEGIKVVIGPIEHKDFKDVKKYNDLIFISPSNIDPNFNENIISIGINLESQLIALINFIEKQKKKKTLIMYPKNQYSEFIEKKIEKLNLNKIKTFMYNSNPEVLTGEIETLTNYTKRKKNLELRKKMFMDKEDEESIKELARLERVYTLGEVNFDSVIIIDFGHNLKSVLTSLVYTDVDQEKVLFTTINQWFEESIFNENTIKNLYYPSINHEEFKKYNDKYFKKFKSYPNEISILTYDALGLIYYAWKTKGQVQSINDFSFNKKIQGKLGTYSLKGKEVFQELDIYKTEKNRFKKF